MMAALSARDAQPERVLADLRELAALTGGPDGARRVCWTGEWEKARQWELRKLSRIPSCTTAIDEAGNLWATIPGARPDVVVVGSHIDSVPHGGWLDGCLGVITAMEVLRRYEDVTPPVTLRLVDWADEEGSRFGRSLLGSTAAAGRLVPDEVRGLKDRDGITLPDALAACGVDLDGMGAANSRLEEVRAYLELHIEQGPVLEQLGLPLGAVQGTFGVERHVIRFQGSTSHAGSTPMHLRHDAFLSAARLALEARDIAKRYGGVTTTGSVVCEPGIVTAIAGTCTLLLDQRALDADALAAMWAAVQAAAGRIAAEEGTTVGWEPLFQIEPIPFNPTLIGFAEQAIREVAGTAHALPSGPLHDAAVMARIVPTTMMFCSSINGISHSALEDTPEEHLMLAVRAFNGLADRTIAWVAAGQK
ncbi:MAG: Zn-dependent hydrolase [Chloroflexota bacterium]